MKVALETLWSQHAVKVENIARRHDISSWEIRMLREQAGRQIADNDIELQVSSLCTHSIPSL